MAFTVTATQGGTGTSNGMYLLVKVLTNAAVTQNGATRAVSGGSTPFLDQSITTTVSGSQVYGAITDGGGGAFTADARTTIDPSAGFTDVNLSTLGGFWATSLTGTPGATTLGSSATPAGAGNVWAAVEVLPNGTLTVDGSSPARATSATLAVTTASFTPPAGSLLVAMVCCDGGTTITMSDTSGLGLTWVATSFVNGTQAGVFLAQIPAAAAPVPGGRPGRTWLRRFRHHQVIPAAPATAQAPTTGPPVYPLSRPVQARQLPLQGGRTASRDGGYAQAGPPVRQPDGPVRAQPAVPFLSGRADSRTGTYGRTGPPVRPLSGPVRGQPQSPFLTGRADARTGPLGVTGSSVRPLHGPVRIAPAPPPRGRVQARAGTFTSTAVTSGPPVRPLSGPVQARRLPQRGGTVTSRDGTYAGTGPQVRQLRGPVTAAQPLPPHGRVQSRSGTFTGVVITSGPPVYPLHGPVRTRPQSPPRGRIVRAAGTYAGTGPPARAWHAPAGIGRQQPPPPTRGRTASQRGPAGTSGPPVIRLRKPVRGQPQKPLLTGRADWRAGTFTPPVVPLFQVARSTATVTAQDTAASTATDPRDGTNTVTAGRTSASQVTDPRDGTTTVTTPSTSTSSIT